MKKTMCLFLAVLTVCALFCACSGPGENEISVNTFGDTTNGVRLNKDLTVNDCMLYDFDEDKYDVKEYSGFLQEELDEYNQKHPYQDSEGKFIEAIKVDTCSVKKDILTQILTYYDASDLVNYNRSELQKRSGSTLQAGYLSQLNDQVLQADYVYLTEEPLDLQELSTGKNANSYRYLICDFKAVLYGEGKIVAYTKNAVYTDDLNCVTSKGGDSVIVIYK